MNKIMKLGLIFLLIFSAMDSQAAKKGKKNKPTPAATRRSQKPKVKPLPPKAQEAKDCTLLLTESVATATTFWGRMVQRFMGGPNPEISTLPTHAARQAQRPTESRPSYSSGPSSSGSSKGPKPPSPAEIAARRAKAMENLNTFKKENPNFASLAREAGLLEWLNIAAKREGRWSVGFLLDSPGVRLTDSKKSEIANLVETYVQNNWKVIYDAEATSAELISEIAGEHGIGIASARSRSKSVEGAAVLVIQNSYLRLDALTTADRTIVAAGSTNGLAALIRDKSDKIYVFKNQRGGSYNASKWEPGSSEPSLGFKLKSSTSIRENHLADVESRSEMPSIFSEAANVEKMLKRVSPSRIEDGITIADGIRRGLSELPTQDGAAVYGSGSYPDDYTEMVYAAVRVLAEQGMAVTTGGSGGVMEIANAAAWDAGAPSIGIPMGSGFKLKSEMDTADTLHSSTFNAAGYEVRIPLLLHNKSLVVIAPGGRGTVKEIATWLVKVSSTPANQPRAIVFLGSPYYDGFVEGMLGFLPKRVKDSVFVAKDQQEMAELVELLKQEFWTPEQVASLTESAPVTARNDHTQFFVDGFGGGLRKKYVPPPPSSGPRFRSTSGYDSWIDLD